MNKAKYLKRRAGSIALEASIVFTIFLALVVSVITFIDIKRTDILMQTAVDETCEKLQILPPFRIPVQDFTNTAVNIIPDDIYSGLASSEALMNVFGGLYKLDNIGEGRIEDIILSVTFGNLVSDDIANEFVILNDNSDFFMPDSIKSTFEINRDSNYIGLTVTYLKNTIVGSTKKQIYAAIPMYGEFDLNIEGTGIAEENIDDVWSKDNFTRGLEIRKNFGANLPSTYPVIDAYNNGTVTSILSIDTTAPHYSKAASILGKVYGDINELAEFEGADVRINGEEYCINRSDIESRELIIVIPENDEKFDDMLCNDIIVYGLQNGVSVHIEMYGNSYKYIDE